MLTLSYDDSELISTWHALRKEHLILADNADEIKGVYFEKMYERGLISEPPYVDYFSFDFNDDGLEDYLLCYHSALRSGSGGNHVCIYTQENDGSLSEVFSITMREPQIKRNGWIFYQVSHIHYNKSISYENIGKYDGSLKKYKFDRGSIGGLV